MNDTSSPYDKFKYECKVEFGEKFTFTPVGGINPIEWGNISAMARALSYLGFHRGVSCYEIRTKKGHFENDLDRACEALTSALVKGIIEVDERRKLRKAEGYGDCVRKDAIQGKEQGND